MTESLTLMQSLAQFHFLRPLWLLALLPALFFFSRLWRLDAQGSAWHKVIDKSLLPYLLNASKSTSQRMPLILLIAAWVIATLALAGPTWTKQTQPVQERQEALVIVLDLSLGMFANDQDPNRITVARRKIMDLLDTRREGQTALVVYAGEAHMVTPLTDDSVTIRAMVPALSPNIMPVIGNNPAEAIAMANALMDDASAVNGRILLVTQNVPRDQNTAIQEILSHNRYPLHIIGVGTPQGAAIPVSNGEFLRDNSGQMVVSAMDRGNLQALSSSLNGRYSDISINASDLESVLTDSLLRGDDDSYLESDEEVELWQDAGPWLLLLLLPLCALCFRRGWVLQISLGAGLVLAALPPQPAMAQQDPLEQQAEQQALEAQPNAPTLLNEEDLQEMAIGGPPGQGEAQPAPEQGFDISSLWLNRDQRGVRALQQGNPQTATRLFETPEWQGAAAFRAGDYQAAINAFSQGDDIDSIYNLGNALAFAERLEEALAAYDRVLAQDPQHEDALKNKAIVEDLLEEQQQQEQEQQEQEEQEQQEQQDSQSESDSDDSEQDQQQEQQEQEQQEQSEQEQEQQQQESESENADQGQQRSDAQVEQEEDQESLEQFLRRIEDDPGELLQRKFQFESRRRMIERRTSGQNSQ
ncbi:hypothetical protein PHACT_12960 [Pseudohongiella acticola]|uniref:VWFA domain-containing protein n=1 Tax=Pseudohongiella acticola TaxID=1524254 RepID=A0A1E8CGL5_9GAMM|nr:VWA domain-containing protein [Pseudohongiella acticola]OFE11455.1 hypothetical protein PHACT_12960 [Pseudohongiella acticola]